MIGTPIRVSPVDDHELLSESLVRLLDDDPMISVIGSEKTALAGIERAAREQPRVVIMDYSLPDLDGACATRPDDALTPVGRYLAKQQKGSVHPDRHVCT